MLAGAVFGRGERDRLLVLNSITHKSIIERTKELMDAYLGEGVRGVAVDAPALFESGFDSECDVIVCVTAPRELSVQRISERDGISAEAAGRRIDSQLDEQTLVARSDYVIENDGKHDLYKSAEEIIRKVNAD